MTADAIFLRPAREEDCRLIYRWRSDPVVRANSFHTEEIPYDVHRAWFAALLADPSRRQFIAEVGGVPVGQIRYALEDGDAVISYSIEGAFRGRGLGTALLAALRDALHTEPEVLRLLGNVKKGNTASRRAFLKAGFAEEGPDEEGNYRYTLAV